MRPVLTPFPLPDRIVRPRDEVHLLLAHAAGASVVLSSLLIIVCKGLASVLFFWLVHQPCVSCREAVKPTDINSPWLGAVVSIRPL